MTNNSLLNLWASGHLGKKSPLAPAPIPVKAQLWGQFWHKMTLVHRPVVVSNLVRICEAVRKQACAQWSSYAKYLMQIEKCMLSTEKHAPYYYY